MIASFKIRAKIYGAFSLVENRFCTRSLAKGYLWDLGRRNTTMTAVATKAIAARSCVAKAIFVLVIIGKDQVALNINRHP
jgi:hypothetical protein